LKHLNYLSLGHVVKKTASDFVGQHVGESQTKTNSILEAAAGKVLVIDEAYALDDNLYGKQVLDTLVEKVQGSPSDDIAVLLLGYTGKITDMIRNQNPGLARRFPIQYAFYFEDYTNEELLQIFVATCRKDKITYRDYRVPEKAIEVLERQRGLPNFGNVGTLKLLLQSAVAKASLRIQGHLESILIEVDDIETGAVKDRDPFQPLNKLCNVDNIRDSLISIRNTFQVAIAEGDEKPEIGHFIFRGSPGTGKTTVARVMADILFQMELIASKSLVETSGSGITGEYVGQTKKKVNELLGQAKGSILFIDEAYDLGKGVFGEEAMTTLLSAMTSPEYKGMVIILAGYPKDIDEMLNRNAGLKSRFTKFFDFLDWTPDQCKSYLVDCAMKENFALADGIERVYLDGLKELITLPGWANARDVIRLWKDTLKYRANRVVNNKEVAKSIQVSDVQPAIDDMIKARKLDENIKAKASSLFDPRDLFLKENLQSRTQEGKKPTINVEFEELYYENNAENLLENTKYQEPDDKSVEYEESHDEFEHVSIREKEATDEEWRMLQEAKRMHEEVEEKRKEGLFKLEIEYKERDEEIKRIEETLVDVRKYEDNAISAIYEHDTKEKISEEQKKRLEKERIAAIEKQAEILRREKETRDHIAEEFKIQEALRLLGKCPAGFNWYKCGNGWRCSGGSHFVMDTALYPLI
jgi:DNA polymerase III delta prime subunit